MKKRKLLLLFVLMPFVSLLAVSLSAVSFVAKTFAEDLAELQVDPEATLIEVPYLNQLEVVYGCEAVSATMVLQYYGYEIGWKDFTDNYLIQKPWQENADGKRFGPDPNAAYPGDPYRDSGPNCGFGCYAPVLAKSMNKVLDPRKHNAVVTTGLKLIDLVENYINKKQPVLIWATMDMLPSKLTCSWTIDYVDENSPYQLGDNFTWLGNEHCLVLVGYDNDKYYFNDPYKNHGLIGYEKSVVEKRFEEFGKQSVVIRSTPNWSARTKVVDYMRALGTVEWVAREDSVYWNPKYGVIFKKGETYHGIPYTQNNRETFLEQFKIETVEGIPYYAGPYGSDAYLGSDCSSSTSMAWQQVDLEFPITSTHFMFPEKSQGRIVPVGDYEIESLVSTSQTLEKNGRERIFAAYSSLQPGDAVLTHRSGNNVNVDGHVRLVSRVDIENQTVYCIEQTGVDSQGILKGGDSTWRVDYPFTYNELFETGYIPIGLKVLCE
ncbi:MAG: C39 family peptidase [Planctomycetia bacterium]|nr:C39 family peptidase [Planctomycetia bacterium]